MHGPNDGDVNRKNNNTPDTGNSKGRSGAEQFSEAISFLEQLRPNGPWVLTAITPDGPMQTITAHTAAEIDLFVREHNGKRNIYYSVNPTRTPMIRKAAKTDIAAIELLLSDLDPRDAENFLARIALLCARGHLDIQSAQELSGLVKTWIDSQYAKDELQFKINPPEQRDVTIRVEGGLPLLPGTNITMPVLEHGATNGHDVLAPPAHQIASSSSLETESLSQPATNGQGSDPQTGGST